MEETTNISETKLRKIKRLSQLAALLSLAIFLVLIIYSARRLSSINAEIKTKTDDLKTKTDDLEKAQGKLTTLKAESHELEERINKQKEQIKFQGEIIRESPDVKESVKRADASDSRSDNVLPLIYLHIVEESQRKRAKELANKLQEKGYIVPEIENVGKKPSVIIADKTVLRIFQRRREEDVSDIFNFLKSENVDVRNPEPSNISTRPRQYEIFFSRNFK